MEKKPNQKKLESIRQLKVHLNLMKKELGETHKQFQSLEKWDKTLSEWEKIDSVSGKSIEDLRRREQYLTEEVASVQKQLKKSASKTLLITELSLLPVIFLLLMISGIGQGILDSAIEESNTFKSKYFIENLRGDTLDTWKSWRLVGTTMNVNLIAPNNIPDEQVEAVADTINSMEAIEIDDLLTHKGPKGSTSTYYLGWKGALIDAARKADTKYQLPSDFDIIKSSGAGRGGDIIITLSNVRDTDGYTGYTKSIVQGNEILKSFITIYDSSNLSDEELSTIVRHEFGHSLGLGHSTAPEDLMAPTIDMTYPYISECNVAAMIDLYNGKEDSSTVCEK